MRKFLIGFDKKLASAETTLIILLLSVMVLMAFLQVVLRNLFSYGIVWGDIFLRHLVLWVGFIGASLATRESKHINIELLSRITPRRVMPYVRILIDLVSAGICLLLARAGLNFLLMEIEADTTIFLQVPAWIFQLIIPVGFALIALRFLLQIAEQVAELVSPGERENNGTDPETRAF